MENKFNPFMSIDKKECGMKIVMILYKFSGDFNKNVPSTFQIFNIYIQFHTSCPFFLNKKKTSYFCLSIILLNEYQI